MGMNLDQRSALIALDAIQAWLQKIFGELQILSGRFPAEPQVIDIEKGIMSDLLEKLVSQCVPSVPAITREIQVTTSPTLIFNNDARPYIRIEVTNDDPAQPVWLSGPGVTRNNGRVLLAQNTVAYSLPQGSSLWGVCVVGAISIRIAEGFDLIQKLSQR